MKRIRTIAISFLMLLATSCSLLGGAGDAKAKEGWKAIQGRKGETYYESCEWYFIQDISIAIGSVYKGNNVFDHTWLGAISLGISLLFLIWLILFERKLTKLIKYNSLKSTENSRAFFFWYNY